MRFEFSLALLHKREGSFCVIFVILKTQGNRHGDIGNYQPKRSAWVPVSRNKSVSEAFHLILKATAAHEFTHNRGRWYLLVTDGQEESDELQQPVALCILRVTGDRFLSHACEALRLHRRGTRLHHQLRHQVSYGR